MGEESESEATCRSAPYRSHVDPASSAALRRQAYCSSRACWAQGLLRQWAYMYVTIHRVCWRPRSKLTP